MKLGDFLNTIAAKCGKQKEFESVVNNPVLSGVEIPDDVANGINSDLFTLDSAKNNSSLKTHFSAIALNGVDSEILAAVEALGLGDSVKSELSGEKNTYEKQRKLVAQVKTAMEGLKNAKNGGDPKDIEKYTKQINDLRGELSRFKESHIPKSELEALKKTHESDLTGLMVRNLLSTKKYANENVPVDVNVLTAQTLVNNALSQRKALLVRDGGILKLKRTDDPALDYFDEQNKQVSFADIVDKTLADSKMLAVSNPNNQQQRPPAATPQTVTVDSSGFNAAVNKAIANLKD
jgi:hypothetical protein